MQKSVSYLVLIALLLSSCSKKDDSVLIAFEVFCEMIANDAKPVALGHPLKSDEIDELWDEFTQIAEEYDVKIYKENDFPVSMLFPAEATADKSVVFIYDGDRLKQYEQYKTDLLAADPKDRKSQEEIARRFGRLLGYTPQGINQLLSKNSDYRNLASYSVEQHVTHLYYDDIVKATEFYGQTLGFAKISAAKFQVSTDVFIELHPTSDVHPSGQVKSTAIAFLTDQLPEWYAHVQAQNVPIKYTYKPREGGPHDGFVAIDPGGYLLEFEQFKQHPENELFVASLADAPRFETSVKNLNFYGSITWTYHNDMLLMQKFYEEVLGYQLVANQGWTKIYQTSKTGFIGLVDERRGMEDYADTKAVEIEWGIQDMEGFTKYAENFWQQYSYEDNSVVGPEKYIYRVSQIN